MSSALLSVKNLSIGIRKNGLLDFVKDISFDIYPGEIVGIVGESGSGKSLTALSLPVLLETSRSLKSGWFLRENKEVTGGSILFRSSQNNGASQVKDLLSLSEKELNSIRGKEISMIFQEPFSSLNPLVKIGKQIEETLILHGDVDKTLIKSKVVELMERLGLPEPAKLAESYPFRLSGGMCQRVMIALAVICKPRLLIADEPTTALDINTQGQILGLLKEINGDLGTSILLISHDLSVVKSICDRVLVMYCGRILEQGNTEEIFTRPAHEYSKGLLGSIPDREKKGKDLIHIPGKVPSLEEGLPGGCPFHPRCTKALPLCTKEFPAARSLNATHITHCVLDLITQDAAAQKPA